MSFTRLIIALTVACIVAAPAGASFDDDFTGNTLRIDYYHSGTAAEEHVSLDRLRVEGVWAGSRAQLIDPSHLGQYLVEVTDADTGRPLYSRGFSSIYGEWRTIAEARAGVWRTFPEAVRVPEPRRPIEVRLSRRDENLAFQEMWHTKIDPASHYVERPEAPVGDVIELMNCGPVESKVDIVILGDGYAADERDKFHTDARRACESIFIREPFTARRLDFNVRAVFTPARESGVTHPRKGQFRNSPLGVKSNIFDTDRYALTFADRAWRDAAAAVPYDFTIILINGPVQVGGGIHNLYAITASDSPEMAFLTAHEFGHHFAGLADEYYVGSVAYEVPTDNIPEPWEPNVTAMRDPAKLKWKDLVDPDTPLPTPWKKTQFEQGFEAWLRGENLKADGVVKTSSNPRPTRRDWYDSIFTQDPYAGKVGAFEGAMYSPRGLYRPCLDCIMHTWSASEFCPVCRRAIERAIDLYTH